MKKQNLTQQWVEYIQAGYTAFYLKTAELSRADDLVSKVAESLNFKVLEYNLGYGKVNFDNKHVLDENQNSFEKILNSLRHEELENCLIFIKDAKLGLENNPVALSRLKYLLDTLNQYKGECALILQSADVYLPNEIEPLVNLIELPLLDQTQIQAVLNEKNIANELTDRLSTALSGLNELDIERLLSLLKNKYGELKAENEKAILAEIQQQKEQIIAKSGVLEMVKVNEAIDDIGGLEKLKAWLQDQSYIVKNLQAAKEFGVKAPKGTLIAGMPGCGKSLTAKAAAALFQQPLLRLDIGSLLGKYVGESETNMRKALAMAESISPCVLWVDELEKAFVGMTGNNASEVSSRLPGYFLTWLQEKTASVFIIATANDITALPPELLRKGRFDEIFYVGFPTKKERKKIIEIHLAKAKQQASEFDIDALASECRDYAGADIENAIFDAVKKAFISNDKILTQDLLLEAIRKTTPLRKTLKDKVGEYEKIFDELYLSPSSENDGLSIAQMVKMAKDPNYIKRLQVAKDENVTEEILEDLAKDDVFDIRVAVFKNINCPTKVLDEQLSLDEKDKLYAEKFLDIIYQNKNVSFALALDKWKEDDKTRSRIDHLFKNNDISLLENQEAVLERGKDYPKQLLAQHKDILDEIVERLLEDKENTKIKENLARNERAAERYFDVLVKDNDINVRLALAGNKNIPKEILLTKENDARVRKMLLNNKNMPNEMKAQLKRKNKT
nr:AAA family ATPase [uncultured Haemophilus sp.]